MIFLFCLFGAALGASFLAADNEVGQSIDRSIEFDQAGRPDLAKMDLLKLLQGRLLPVERAAVLYNLSCIYSQDQEFWEGLTAINQIDAATLAQVKEASPLLYVHIVYNGAIISLDFAKQELAKIVRTQEVAQHQMLDTIQKSLDSAQEYASQLPPAIHRYVLEEIVDINRLLEPIRELFDLEQLTKSQFLDHFLAKLQVIFQRLSETSGADGDSAPYLQAFKIDTLPQISLSIQRTLLFLTAPASHEQQLINSYLSDQLSSFSVGDSLFSLLSSIRSLMLTIEVIQGNAINGDVLALLSERLQIGALYAFSYNDPAFRDFWQNEWQITNSFASSYLKVRGGPIFEALQRHLQASSYLPDANQAQDDIDYWKILSTNENETFSRLAKQLHEQDVEDLQKELKPFLDRLEALHLTAAYEAVAKMEGESSPTPLFQELMQGWYAVDPDGALKYLINLLQQEMAEIQTSNATEKIASLAQSDFQLLSRLIPQSTVKEDLMKRSSWLTSEKRNDLDYFKMSLDLSWLQESLTNRKKTIEAITNKVDFEIEFQKKAISLLRFSDEEGFKEMLQQIFTMQTSLAGQVTEALEKLPTKGPKIKEVQKIMEKVKKNISSMPEVLDLLQQASKILHSLQAPTPAPQTSELTQNQNLSIQLQNRALKLNPENSIRLLQEMERQDRSLEVQTTIPQVAGPKPW